MKMQLKLSFVAGLIASSTLAFGAPSKQDKGINIAISKRGSLTKPNSEEVDWKKVKAHMAHIEAKYANNLKNYEQNTGERHPLQVDLPITHQKRATGSVPLVDQQNGYLWTGNIAFGTPAQNIVMDFDTGSADTIINPGVYNPSASKMSKKTSKTFKTGYGDGSSSNGTVYTDSFQIAGLSANNVAIGILGSQLMNPSQGAVGLSGMSFPQIATFGRNYPPFFNSLMSEGVVDQSIFQFDLRESGLSLYLGGTDSSKYQGDITWVPVKSPIRFWIVDANFNGKPINAVVDSGTTVILAPVEDAVNVFEKLGLQYFQTPKNDAIAVYNCDQPPKATFTFGERDITLSDENSHFAKSDNMCAWSVTGSAKTPLNFWILGDPFFKSTVAMFDFTQNRVGFADKA